MPKVRFVEGGVDDYSIVYDTEWPIAPRTGEFLSITGGTGQVMDWESLAFAMSPMAMRNSLASLLGSALLNRAKRHDIIAAIG